MSSLAVSQFDKGDFDSFQRQLERLDALKLGTIRSLLNQEEQTLVQTEQTAFNNNFTQQMNGDDEDIDEEDEP